MKRTAGFTLIELLVSAALLLVLLSALAGMMRSTTHAYQAEDVVTTTRQNQESALGVLRYEIALAGYRGTLKTDYDANSAVATDPFTITSGNSGGSDQIAIKYFENHVYGGESKSVKTIVFSVNAQTQTLLRSQNGATAQAIATHIKRLKIVRYLVKGLPTSDCASACASKPPVDATGIILSLTFADDSVRRVPITFQNPVTA